MLPSHLRKYFWDSDIHTLHTTKYRKYIIERILEMGDERAAVWMEKAYAGKDIITVLKKSRRLSPLSKNYWKLMYGLK